MWTSLEIMLYLAGFSAAQLTPPLPGAVVNNPTPPLLTCADKIANCKLFPESSCKAPYESWAKDSCAATCKYCVGPATSPPPCVDKIGNCDVYPNTTCSDSKYSNWAEENCRLFCRKCTIEQLMVADSIKTTMNPSSCVDKVDCRTYGKTSCTGDYLHWAKENCPEYCGLCVGQPKPPPACVDKLPNCINYDPVMCTNSQYRIWAEDNCLKTCKFCSGGATSSPGFLTPPPITG